MLKKKKAITDTATTTIGTVSTPSSLVAKTLAGLNSNERGSEGGRRARTYRSLECVSVQGSFGAPALSPVQCARDLRSRHPAPRAVVKQLPSHG